MTYSNIRNTSYAVSVVLHLIILGLFFIITFNIEYPSREFVEVGFGNFGAGVSSGGKGTEIEGEKQPSSVEEAKAEPAPSVVKEIELPKTKNTETENVITQTEKTKETAKENSRKESTKNEDDDAAASSSDKVIGNKGEGEGGLGYDIDWGGRGSRKIYSYILPEYPDGVSKEIDVRLRFSILPDGTVGKIFPLIKADTRLENAAINSLRKWRFEPLNNTQKQMEQIVIIVFPYRLQ